MKTVEETRLDRLSMLVDEFGSYAELNKRMGKTTTDSTLSQYANKAAGSKTGKPKEMGSVMARKLEEAAGKPRGWMDHPTSLETVSPDSWPFKRIVMARVLQLPPDELAYVEAKLDTELLAAEHRLGLKSTRDAAA